MRNSAITAYKTYKKGVINNKKKNEIHSKIKSLRETYNPKGHIYSSNNELAFSQDNINKYKRKITIKKERNYNINNIKINRYDSIAKTERNNGKEKPILEMNLYDGNKTTKANNGKIGNFKFYNNNNRMDQKQKNIYYGPIDIGNIAIDNSIYEINEKIIDILNKNKVKNWKMNQYKFYCNKNGIIFVLEIFLLPNKIIVNNNKIKEKEESLFDSQIYSDNNEDNKNKEGNNNDKSNKQSKSKKMFYITVFSKNTNNQDQAKSINKIINKSLWKMYKIK